MTRMVNLSKPYTNQKNVTTSGTPVQLPSQDVPPGVLATIKAKDSNTGSITVGYSSATALNTSGQNYVLRAGAARDWQVQNISSIWIDATVSGEGVEITFEI